MSNKVLLKSPKSSTQRITHSKNPSNTASINLRLSANGF